MKAIVFDFDGVIVDSNRLKYEAWYELFPVKEVSPALIKDVLARIPETRFEILREIFVKLGKPINEIEELVSRYAEKYGEAVFNGILERGLFPESEEILRRLSQNYILYLNSATPEESLRMVVSGLGFQGFFRAVCGKPTSKEDNLRKILNDGNLLATEVAFVGDGEPDYSAAKAVGCYFIGIANDFNNWKEQSFPLVSSLAQLEGVLESIAAR